VVTVELFAVKALFHFNCARIEVAPPLHPYSYP
jgi:hypothetical protein